MVNKNPYALTDHVFGKTGSLNVAIPYRVVAPLLFTPISVAYHHAEFEADRIFLVDTSGNLMVSKPYDVRGPALIEFSRVNCLPISASDRPRAVHLAYDRKDNLLVYLATAEGKILRAKLSNADRVEGASLKFSTFAEDAPSTVCLPIGNSVMCAEGSNIFLYDNGAWDWRVKFPEPISQLGGYELPDELRSRDPGSLYHHSVWALSKNGNLYRWYGHDPLDSGVHRLTEQLPDDFIPLSLSVDLGKQRAANDIGLSMDGLVRRLNRGRVEKVMISGIRRGADGSLTYEIGGLTPSGRWEIPEWHIPTGATN